MTEPVVFVEERNSRIAAMIGSTLVGYIAYWPDGDEIPETFFRVLLPFDGAMEPPKHAKTMPGAKRSLLLRLCEWHHEADPVRYAAMIADLQRQADGVR